MGQGQFNLWAKSYINDGYLLLLYLITPEEYNDLKAEMLKIFRGDYTCEVIPPIVGRAVPSTTLMVSGL